MVLTKTLIEESEKDAVLGGAFSFRELMGIAGSTAAKIIEEKYGCASKKVAVICGNGNNGGDGFCLARNFYEHGAEVSVLMPCGKPKTENAQYYFNKLSGIKFTDEINDEYDIIVDALFGIGLNRNMSDEIISLFSKINSFNCKRVAIDLPSGAECDTGKVLGGIFDADLTVTFIALKPCFLLPPASDYCGEVIVADIGVTPKKCEYEIIKEPIFPKRKHNSHKGTFGTAVLLCGSYGMAGAAVLAAKAALKSGVGIAKCVLCESVYPAFTAALPEAVCVPIKQSDSGTLKADEVDFDSLENKATALLFGCGVGKGKDVEELLKKIIIWSKIPIVIDADGINALAQCIDILKECKTSVIITPHPAEMARLCKKEVADIEADRVGFARYFAVTYGCTVVLKGANTIVASPKGDISFNVLGNTGMAKGGSGDVLSGVTVSLLAQGFSSDDAARGAVYLHSEAGDKAAEKRGLRAVLASDIVDEL